MDTQSNTIMEIITIYRKMKKGRDNQNIYRMQLNIEEERNGEVEDFESYQQENTNTERRYNFYEFRNVHESKYMFFSKESNLRQSNQLFSIPEWEELQHQKYYWLNIFNPSEKDLQVLATTYNIHDISIIDIREGNTEEKVEVFSHYTFISLKLLSEGTLNSTEDIDFNILLFKDFVITTHDKPWAGTTDILNFLSLICNHTTMYPDWVLFSVIIEFLQDIKSITDQLHPEITAIQNISTKVEISNILIRNFDMVYKVYSLRSFIKPKIQILSTLKTKCARRFRKHVMKYLSYSLNDFKLQDKQAREYNKILERCQDLFLALVNMEQSREGNEMNKAMNRFTQITFISLPCQVIAGLWGMNVQVPWQNESSTFYFYILCLIVLLLSSLLYVLFFTNLMKKFGSRKKMNI
ncbi:putative metal ion transporter C17A12.14 [Astathelohania contejeani]|uniref:Metal ion transporter C17A12.14 n=1 Tax=Astathelohania contejeani TaxID=164912 RepID=A0ABQ7I0T2_9MICR|nr:putative metal ion transporter C17A12.14 [Thelohania contejeani]